MRTFKVAIIGAGPAGIACAIQLKRYEIDFIIFERNKPGGLLRNANLVENYLGFPEKITGEELVNLFCRQLEFNNINPTKENVESIDYKDGFSIKTNKSRYQSEILIVASGTKPKRLNIKIPPNTKSKIFYEVVALKKLNGEKIGIIGSGDAGFDYAIGLSKKNKIIIFNRTDKHKCLPILFKRCMENKNIMYITNFEITKIQLKNKKLVLHPKNKKSVSVDYLIVAIGREPNLDFLSKNIKHKLKMLEKNKKLYMIGDVKNKIFRQTAIAVGNGIKTAMEITMGERQDDSCPKK